MVAVALAVPAGVAAEEAGSGHYMPGGMASFVDALPGKAGPIVEYIFLAYDAGGSRQFPIAGLVTAGVEATVYAHTFAFLYETEFGILGGHYAAGALLPLLQMDISANVTTPLGSVGVSDQETGLGDMTFFPLLMAWQAAGGDLKYDIRFGVYAPTGEYEAGKLTNLGKNYWTFEPSVSLSWLSSRIGTEVSLFTGFDINTKNTATDYESGTSWHLDATVAQHLPLLGGFVGAGAGAFSYVQITDDSGAGAQALGGFRGHTVGVGPVVSYVRETEEVTVAGEFKWLPELDVDKRLEGDLFWLKLAVVY